MNIAGEYHTSIAGVSYEYYTRIEEIAGYFSKIVSKSLQRVP